MSLKENIEKCGRDLIYRTNVCDHPDRVDSEIEKFKIKTITTIKESLPNEWRLPDPFSERCFDYCEGKQEGWNDCLAEIIRRLDE